MENRLTDSQFLRLLELMDFCREHELPVYLMHDIAALALEKHSDEVLDRLTEEVKSRAWPQPLENIQELVFRSPRLQELRLNRDGEGSFRQQDEQQLFCTMTWEAEDLLDEMGAWFSASYLSPGGLPHGETWILELTDRAGKRASFCGSLADTENMRLADFSEILRRLTGRKDLSFFSTEECRYLKLVDVIFSRGPGARAYSFIGNGFSLHPGDKVEVKVRGNEGFSAAEVVDVHFCRETETPLPPGRYSTIYRKLPKNGCWCTELFQMVKSVINRNDPMNLRGFCVPPDEYDYESEEISEQITLDMNREELTRCIAGVLRESFSEEGSTEACEAAGTELRMLLDRYLKERQDEEDRR